MLTTNHSMGEYLCVGDHIALFSVETEGYAYSVQSRQVHKPIVVKYIPIISKIYNNYSLTPHVKCLFIFVNKMHRGTLQVKRIAHYK